jgi:UDP-3-O-[3-hydroxymyristoyl] glucosamine N-acyltransferase
MKKYCYQDIKKAIGKSELKGVDFLFNKVSTLENAESDSLIWISPQKENFQEIINTTKAGCIICDFKIIELLEIPKEKSVLFVENPRLTFLRICKELFTKPIVNGIHKTTTVNSKARISENVYIGPNCYIGECIISDGVQIIGNCFINDNVIIGKNVQIGANCSIGLDGFGYQMNEEKVWEKFPHIGGVIIEDNVEIGSNTCIDRGTIGDTIIKKGVKIDNLVHIAHNVFIGESSMVIANAMIGGSTKIGENVWIAPSSSIRDGVELEDSSFIGLGAVITKSIPNGQVWVGNPGRNISK